MNKKAVLTIVGLIILVGGWYAFRPERLFINETVNESIVFQGGITNNGTFTSGTGTPSLSRLGNRLRRISCASTCASLGS